MCSIRLFWKVYHIMSSINKKKIRYITSAGVMAAVYVTLTGISALFGMSSGTVQLRLSEAMCVLPLFTSAAVPGVTIGCFISNLLFGGTVWDVIFGTLATLIGLLAVRLFKKTPYLAFIPSVVSNALIIPAVLIISAVGEWKSFWLFSATVAAGELLACGLLGGVLIYILNKHKETLFPKE